MRKIVFSVLLTMVFMQSSLSAELYKVNLHSRGDADALIAMNVEPLVWVDGGYLVLADQTAAEQISLSHLDARLVASDVSKDRLAFDGRMDDTNRARYRVLYESGGIRLLLLDDALSAAARTEASLLPIRNEHLTIKYRAPHRADTQLSTPVIADEILDDLLAEISQASLYNYVWSLQEYPYRVVGSIANLGARQWIYDKFTEFGYTNTFVDPVPYPSDCANVIAYKTGTVYPERIIIVGGHYDAVLNSPGADDNGSGTAAMLEIARILKDIELPVTVIFAAFDAEESGLIGASDLADSAVAEDWDILFMMNMDMIAFEGNIDSAYAYHGPEQAFALLWSDLAYEYEGLRSVFSSSSRSDHFPFQQAGYDVVFSHEYRFSDVYHSLRDSTTHMDFVYMTKMVRATLATVYTVAQFPRGVAVSELIQGGDGQSLQVTWQPTECIGLTQYRVSWVETYDPYAVIQSEDVPPDITTLLISGLTEGIDYTVFVQAVDDQGRLSLPYFGSDHLAPLSSPGAPTGLSAMPMREAIRLTWDQNNDELDFDFYEIIRNGDVIDQTTDTSYVDSDPALALDFHSYHVVAVDLDGNRSDTLGLEPAVSRAGTMDPNRILAINRTSCHNMDFVSARETGLFLQQALEGYDYDYWCDTLATTDPEAEPFEIFDIIDYGALVIGAETGVYDDIGLSPDWNGILPELAYYLSIGGRLIVFGRWGSLSETYTINYATNPYQYDDAYHDYFHIDYRVVTGTLIGVDNAILADLVGAHSLETGYPDLTWDSAATMVHSTAQVLTVSSVGGIPCESFVQLVQGATPIYAYDSRYANPYNQGKTVAWKYVGEDYSYAWFDIPLSHFERPGAIAALRLAVEEITEADTWVEEGPGFDELPQSFMLHQNYPNPFNPNTEIVYSLPARGRVQLSIYNILGRKVKTLLDRVQAPGAHTVSWDGTGDDGTALATGIYFYRMQAGETVQTRKMMLLK